MIHRHILNTSSTCGSLSSPTILATNQYVMQRGKNPTLLVREYAIQGLRVGVFRACFINTDGVRAVEGERTPASAHVELSITAEESTLVPPQADEAIDPGATANDHLPGPPENSVDVHSPISTHLMLHLTPESHIHQTFWIAHSKALHTIPISPLANRPPNYSENSTSSIEPGTPFDLCPCSALSFAQVVLTPSHAENLHPSESHNGAEPTTLMTSRMSSPLFSVLTSHQLNFSPVSHTTTTSSSQECQTLEDQGYFVAIVL